MKTILFLNAFGEISGAERSLLTLLDGMDRTRRRPLVAAPEGALLGEVRSRDLPAFPLPPLPVRRPRSPGDAWRAARALRRAGRELAEVIARERPDLLHANSAPAMLCACAVRAPLPRVWHVRDIAPLRPWGRLLYRRAARVIAISDAVALAVRAYAGDGGAKISRVYPGVDLARFRPRDRFAARASLGLPDDMPLIGLVAQFVPWKRHDLFLDALGLLADLPWGAVLAGADFGRDDAYMAHIRERIARPPLAGRVQLLPWQEDPALLYAALDICALTSRNEPFGRALIEAQAAGVPVVAVEEGGPREIVVHEETGLLTSSHPDAVAGALRALLDAPALRAQYGQAGRARAATLFSSAVESRALSDIYAALLGE